MSEQVIAALIGAACVGALKVVDRLLDWFLPSDHHWRGVEKYGADEKEDTDEP